MGLAVLLAGGLALGKKPKKPPPPPPLVGQSFDYRYDGKAEGHPERSWLGRVFVHDKAAGQKGLPVLVFLHGTNADKIKYRWMGGGNEGDVRRIASELMEEGAIPPLIVAAPSSIDPLTMVNAMASWPAFDLDAFLDRTEAALGGPGVLDRGRVIVAAHSGGGCNIHGGLATAMHAKVTPVLAGLSIDTCMDTELAKELANAAAVSHVVVTWQDLSWKTRPFDAFKIVWKRELAKAPPVFPGVLREVVYENPREPMPHDAMVKLALRKWLPRILPPAPAKAP